MAGVVSTGMGASPSPGRLRQLDLSRKVLGCGVSRRGRRWTEIANRMSLEFFDVQPLTSVPAVCPLALPIVMRGSALCHEFG